MNKIDLYIYFPNGSNTSYNKCFPLSSYHMNQMQFLSNLQLLSQSINYLPINKIYYIGGQFSVNKYYLDVFQIFKNFYQVVLTNAINIFSIIKNLNGIINCIDICRFAISQQANKTLFQSNDVPQILEIQQIINQCRENKIKNRIIVPVDDDFNQDILTFTEMSNYLTADIVFRKISNKNHNEINFESHFFNLNNIFYDIRKNYSLIIKQYKNINVWIQNIYSDFDKRNSDYIVYHPNGVLLNNFRK